MAAPLTMVADRLKRAAPIPCAHEDAVAACMGTDYSGATQMPPKNGGDEPT